MAEFLECQQNGRTLSYAYCDRSVIQTHRITVEQKRCSFADYLLLLFASTTWVIVVGRGAKALYPLPFVLAFLLHCARRRRVVQEAVMVVPTLGVQMETVYHSKKVRRRFVPLEKIIAPVINEAVSPVTCYFYLALLLRGEDDLVLTFLHLRPPLKMLVPIWKALCDAAGISKGKSVSDSDSAEG